MSEVFIKYINSVSNKSRFDKKKSVLKYRYVMYWEKHILKEQKMRSYIGFKNHFMYEDYLNLTNVKHRKAITRLRISAHNLAIERGRYTYPKTPVEKRLCKVCNTNEVENEQHFLLHCPLYKEMREDFFTNVGNICPNFAYLEPLQRFNYLLSAGCDIAKLTSQFICMAFNVRHEYIVGMADS